MDFREFDRGNTASLNKPMPDWLQPPPATSTETP